MRIYLLSLLLFLSFNALAQPHMKFNSPYDAQWKKTDSLMNQSLPKSARDIVEKIYQDAQAKNIPVQMLKAQIYFMRLNTRDNEAADSLNIARAESEIQKTPFPLKAVWQSIAAELYWDYYQQNRYKILQRTTTTEAIGNDFEQWDAAKFAAKTSALYYQSLSNAESLKGIAIEAYNPVLVKGHNSENLRPTLFDLLAFRAVGFFENEEAGISKPAFAFVLDDEAAFAPATEFAQHKFKTQDSSSNEFNALLLYQEILRLHATDQNQDAFIDADLQRLSFVYAHSVHPNKKVLYQKSLAQIETRYNTNPLSAMASFTVLQLQMNDQNLEENDGEDDGEIQASNKVDLRPIVKKLEALVQKFPGSEGAINAQGLIAQIQSKSLTLKAEEAVLPNTPSKVLLSYKNLNKVWIRVLKTDAATYRETGNYRDDKYIKTLLAQSPIKAFSVNLPSSDDFRPHSTEVKLDALPLGMYAVLISGKENFQTEDNALSFAIFQATNLAIITQQTPANSKQPLGYILDRKTGSPVPNCQITLFKQEYNNKTYNYDYKPLSIGSSASDGSFKMNNSGESYSGLMLKKGDDVFYSTAYLNFYRYDRTKNNSERTFFFTDRSIYRPGQTIYFKGIVVASEEGGLKNNVVPNKTIEVTFYDANSQKIASQKLKTNEWGSVAGNFVAPAGVLTGMMRIEGNNGSVYVSVEEYKRPKFRVDWDTLKSDYALNEKVSVIGHALAYAGNNVDGAMVKYRVVRNVRWPSWWYYWRYGGIRSAAQEIAQGTTTTDANGNFTVPFQALPDRNIDERSLPVFTYSIHADVTDLNGETRSGDKSLSAGYRSLQIETSIPEMASRKELESIPVSTQNLNGDFVAASVSVKVARLQQPDVIFRKRLWNTPDQFVMSEAEFHAAFPLDAYKDENDYKTWKTASVVAEKTIVTSKNGNLNLPSNTFPNNGWYLLTFSTKDKNGKPVEEKKYVQVWDKENAGKPYAALLVRPDAQTLEPSQKAEVSILSGMDKVHLIRQVQTMDDKVESLQENLENAGSTSVWKKDITEADRGGIALSYITIKDNRVYTGSARVNVPWSNKELNIKWETHRDKLLPGAQEIWTMIVEGNKKDKVAAELVAALYDASLDAFKPHSWSLPSLFPSLNANLNWNSGIGFGLAPMRDWSNFSQLSYPSYWKEYDELIELTVRTYAMVSYNKPIIDPRSPGGRSIRTMAAPMMAKSSAALGSVSNDDKVAKSPTRSIHTSEEIEIQATPPPSKVTDIPIRKNLQETAFFYPQLQTDANGVVRIQFTIPEALTEWKLLAFAHTKDMRTGFTAGTVKTQKDLMVQPGLPRFLRQGDELSISTKIVNLSDKALSGTATLEIINPATNLPLNLAFRLKENKQNFSLEKGSSTSASWTVTMPESRYEPVIIRISAQAGNYTDGEENTLPVLTNRMLVTETMPLWINGNGTKNFTFDKLLQSNQSKTLAQHAVTVEYTANPAWYAVQALPYLMEYPYECAEQTFNRYYANALAAHILDKAPRVKEIFKRWESLDTAALQSNLEKNQELKSALLEETPWVLDAQNETQQKHNIALLFQNAKLARDLKRTAQKLEDMMLPEGGFAWFKGDTRPDRYITQYIVTGLGRLQHLGIKNTTMTSLAARAMPYLDRKMESDYRQLLKDKRDLKQQQIGNFEVQYRYMRSFFPELATDNISKEAVNFYKGQEQKFWPTFNPYTKGMIALALHRDGDMVTTKTIIKSLKETAIEKEELGMYWMEAGRSWWWWEAPIEAQSLLIECFSEVAQDNAAVDKMKRWLLKQKQTQNWSTTKGTADACYALLLQGTQWLNSDPEVSIQLGSKTISSKEIHAEAGTGYFKTRIPGADVKPEMGNISLTVSKQETTLPSWGAVYWQYFENLDKITSAATPLVVKKQLFVERNTDRGLVLEPVSGNLKIGDKVKARIEIIVDRDMEYVHLKDGRASCFEPTNVLSGYHWQGGLGYYESTKDASSNFFFSYLPKGKYVFEYPMFVTNAGDFSAGLATIQCMYAPEFSAHSEGVRVKVK